MTASCRSSSICERASQNRALSLAKSQEIQRANSASHHLLGGVTDGFTFLQLPRANDRQPTSDLDGIGPSDLVVDGTAHAREAVGLGKFFNVRPPNSQAHGGGNFGGNSKEQKPETPAPVRLTGHPSIPVGGPPLHSLAFTGVRSNPNLPMKTGANAVDAGLADARQAGRVINGPALVGHQGLSLTRIQANTGEAATAHLLELEMAVLALRALNQETNALHLLRQHIDAVPLTCAWAYLEYLDICSSIQQRENFELMRQRFRNQFNRLAPYWQESSSTARGLDTYLPALAELCAAWPTLQAKKLIEQWFLGTSVQRRLFQLPAYHDLFDLYDLLDYVDQGSIEQDFSPTVSLLDLDYEFATDVTLEPQPAGAMHAIATLKTGDFDVDVNLFAAPIVDTSAEKPTVMPT